MQKLGFDNISFSFTEYKNTRNIIVKATKAKDLKLEELRKIAKDILKENLLDNSSTEKKMLRVWCDIFDKSLDNMIDLSLSNSL